MRGKQTEGSFFFHSRASHNFSNNKDQFYTSQKLTPQTIQIADMMLMLYAKWNSQHNVEGSYQFGGTLCLQRQRKHNCISYFDGTFDVLMSAFFYQESSVFYSRKYLSIWTFLFSKRKVKMYFFQYIPNFVLSKRSTRRSIKLIHTNICMRNSVTFLRGDTNRCQITSKMSLVFRNRSKAAFIAYSASQLRFAKFQ